MLETEFSVGDEFFVPSTKTSRPEKFTLTRIDNDKNSIELKGFLYKYEVIFKDSVDIKNVKERRIKKG